MRLIRTALPPSSFFIASAPLAYAASSAPIAFGSSHFWWMLAGAQVLLGLGYLASSLPTWAKWEDGTTLERLVIIQGVFVSIVAGNVAFFLAIEYGSSDITRLLASAAGGYGGDKLLSPLLERVLGRSAEK